MGEMQKVGIPDTLLLEERAGFALNALIGVADIKNECIPYFRANLLDKPAWMRHSDWDFGSSHGRLIDAIILARYMSGNNHGKDVEENYRRNLLSFFKEDGLSYRRNNAPGKVQYDHSALVPESANMIDQRAVLLGLGTWYIESGDEKVKEYADKHCAALKRIAIKKNALWYYPASEYMETGWPSKDAVNMGLTVDPASIWGRQIMPLIRYHEITGNIDAFDLAENFASSIIHRTNVFNKDGSFNDGIEYRNGHFHTRMGTLDSLVRFGVYTDDRYIIEYARKCFDWALTQCTGFGWTPGDMVGQAYEHETCTLVDAITIAITLAQNGYEEYWEIAERFIRNHLAESQLLNIDWIEESNSKENDSDRKAFYKVASRMKGAFAGYSAPNDFVNEGIPGREHKKDVQTCCIASGTRGLFVGWSNIVTEKNGKVYINMLLNRGTKWLDLMSYMPYEGRIEVNMNENIGQLLVRIPEWVPNGAITIKRMLNGETKEINGRSAKWHKQRFIRVDETIKGELIEIAFPMIRKTTVEKAAGQEFTVEWYGDDVINITPGGNRHPFYNNRNISDKKFKAFKYKRNNQQLFL